MDRSIKDPFSFAQTNVMGTLSLLQAAKLAWEGDFDGKLFYHVSTDEVYGSLQPNGGFSFWELQNTILILPIRHRKPLPIIS